MFAVWRPQRLSWSARTLGIIAVLLAILVIASAAAAALSPLLRQALSDSPDTHDILKNHLFTEIHQSKTIAGVTINIEAAYADANELIIADTITTADGHTILWNGNGSDNNQMGILRIVVSTKDGTVLGDTHSGKLIVGDSAGQFKDKYRAAEAFYVNTDRITGNPQRLDIHMKMNVGTLTALRTSHVLGSTTFDFSVPFHTGGMIKIGQKQTTDGETITLQRASITPSAVRIFISGQLPWGKAQLYPTLRVPQDSHDYGAWAGSPQDDGSFRFDITNSLYGKHGTWTLMVQEREYAGGKIRTWVFHFNVP